MNLDPILVNGKAPSDGEIRVVVAGLTNGRAGGASGMCAEDEKAWLRGVTLDEDPKEGPNNIGAGDNWQVFVKLVPATWDHGEIPPPTPMGDHRTQPKRRW